MTDIISRILAQVEGRAARARPVEICIGAHWTFVGMEVDGKLQGGLASTLSGTSHDHHHGGKPPVRDAANLLSYSAFSLASLINSDSLLEASVGMAAVNALLEVDEQACTEVNAADVIARRAAGREAAVVGHFPFVPSLRESAGKLWVLELNPGPGDLPAARAPEILPRADVVALTGTSLLNKTFEGLIELCREDAFVIILGATAPLSTVFFDVGVDAVAGTLVVDPAVALQAVKQAATFRQIPGKRLLTLFKDRAAAEDD
ncbi:MAG: Rossmann-like domain-containing protein [Anaerolineae bacterium]